MQCLILLVALLTAQTALPRVIDVNEHTKEVHLSVGDYLRFTSYTNRYYSFRFKENYTLPYKTYKFFHLVDPKRFVNVYKITGNIDSVELLYTINTVGPIIGGVCDAVDAYLISHCYIEHVIRIKVRF